MLPGDTVCQVLHGFEHPIVYEVPHFTVMSFISALQQKLVFIGWINETPKKQFAMKNVSSSAQQLLSYYSKMAFGLPNSGILEMVKMS